MLNYFRKIKSRHYVILILVVSIYTCSAMCTSRHDQDDSTAIHDSYGNAFAGTAACISCHRAIGRTHSLTAHYLDSRPAAAGYIKGSFDSGRNRITYENGTRVLLEHKGNAFFQTTIQKDGRQSRSEQFGVVIGSGRKGQTYLYWNDARLFQLPVSYFSPTDSWCNSPGYRPDAPYFDRQVPAYCLECHATYAGTVFRSKTDLGDRLDSNRIVYGINCEKCHGPGAAHVAFQTAHPEEKTGKYIINARLLSRQQRLDACALCHSGARSLMKPAFSFRVGDTLNQFSLPKYDMDSAETLDVHGNQYGLLTSSRCFRQSQMDCSSCHNPHVNEANNPKLFSQRCMTCHNPAAHNTCTVKPAPGLVLSDNCIDCHMPALPSQKIVLTLAASPSRPGNPTGAAGLSASSEPISNLVRTHHIAIYPAATATRPRLTFSGRPPDSSP
jgi:hypothetical protein